MYLIIGLGNPGKGYAKTRHNAGFIALDYVAKQNQIKVSNRERLCLTGSGKIGQELVTLAKPRTYMNLSGEAVKRLVVKYKVMPESVVVLHDDLDLKQGQIRIRASGGSGGHKGVDSIASCLGTQNFIRFRIGIDRPASCTAQQDIVDYVLGEFSKQELGLIEKVLQPVNDAITLLLTDGPAAAMNRFNRLFTHTETG